MRLVEANPPAFAAIISALGSHRGYAVLIDVVTVMHRDNGFVWVAGLDPQALWPSCH